MSLEHLVPTSEYVPDVYKDVKEMNELVKAEDHNWDILISLVDKEYARMYIQTSDEIGVERFERVMQITADPSIETLQFRKERLLARSNSTLPYTTIWIRNYLNAVIGEPNYELDVDYDNLIITLYGFLLDYSWAREVGITIRTTKPCNVVFINVPTLIENVEFQKWVDENTWNSNIWNDENVWSEFNIIPKNLLPDYEKLPEEHSNLQAILNEIKNIRLNKNTSIEELGISVQSGTIYIEFTVPEDIKLLTDVEIIDKNDSTLLYTPCYIDTPSGTKLIIRITCYQKKEN